MKSGFSFRNCAASFVRRSFSAGFVGPRFEPPELRRIVTIAARCRRARMKVLGLRKILSDQCGADHLTFALNQAAVGLRTETVACAIPVTASG